MSQYLDVIDSKPVIDMMAEFQTHAMQQVKIVASRQEVLVKKITNCKEKSTQCVSAISQKAEKLQKLSASLREVERVSRYIEQTKNDVNIIIAQIKQLEQSLPANVKNSVNTPLFSMVEQ